METFELESPRPKRIAILLSKEVRSRLDKKLNDLILVLS